MTTRRSFLKGTTATGIAFCSCGLGDAARAQPKAPRLPVKVGGKRVLTVDVHSHCYFHEALNLMGDAADKVLPMPLSKQRLKTRGFNQALILARQLAPDKTDHRLLLRIKDTPPQSSLRRADRLNSLDHAFAVEPLLIGQLKGARLVLIDDVMTSGASLYAAARVLRAAGAAHITALVIARTE